MPLAPVPAPNATEGGRRLDGVSGGGGVNGTNATNAANTTNTTDAGMRRRLPLDTSRDAVGGGCKRERLAPATLLANATFLSGELRAVPGARERWPTRGTTRWT